MKKITAVIVLAAITGPALAQAYKCKGPGGTFTYQGLPCDTGGEQISTQANGPTKDPERQRQATTTYKQGRTPVTELDPATITIDQQAVYNGMMGSYPVVGMNLTQLDWALGQASKVTTEQKDGYRLEIHAYRKKGPWYDVYVREGMVVRIMSVKLNSR